jgi:hypothetical protein
MPKYLSRPNSQIQARPTAPLVIASPQIAIVLDKSGSMETIRAETISGVNRLIVEQQEKPESQSEPRLTLTLFNDRASIVHEAAPIRGIPLLAPATYVPSGGTALNDAIAHTIQCVGQHSSRLSPALVAVVSDGCENVSRSFKTSDIRQMIDYRQGTHSWAFVFLGPSDALDYARSIGIPAENCISFTASAQGITAILDRLSKTIGAYLLGDSRYALRLRDKS